MRIPVCLRWFVCSGAFCCFVLTVIIIGPHFFFCALRYTHDTPQAEAPGAGCSGHVGFYYYYYYYYYYCYYYYYYYITILIITLSTTATITTTATDVWTEVRTNL